MLDINIRNNEIENPFIIGLDYDGVITKRGSSGENEEKWLKREKNFLWRKVLNLISKVYNSFFPLNKEIIELTNLFRELGCKIVVISSHILTTTDYKESEQTRTRLKNRLKRKGVAHDDVVFVAGDKVDVCQKLGVNLMIEDNVDKIKALREGSIPTVAKKTNKNRRFLKNDPDAIDNLLDTITFVITGIANKNLLDRTCEKVTSSDNELSETHENNIERKPGLLYAAFSSLSEEESAAENLSFDSIFVTNPHLRIPAKKLLTMQRRYKKQTI